MSKKASGENNQAYGKHWWNNGIEQIFCKECPAEGWVRGMIKGKGRIAWNKGKHHSPEQKTKMSASRLGKKWWHLPSGETKFTKESPGPEWLPGRK